MAPRSWAVATLAAFLLAAGPGASVAAAGLWTAPAQLGPGAGPGDIDVQANGTAVAAWTGSGNSVRASIRRAGNAFGSPVTLAADGGQAVAVAIDGSGGALVAFARNGDLGLAERTAAAPALTTVASGVTGVASGPDVAFTGAGDALVVWTGTDGAVHALARTLGGATTPLPDLAAGPGNFGAHVDVGGGHAVVAWTHSDTSGTQTTTTVRASDRPPGGSFGAAADVASTMSDTATSSGSLLQSNRVVVAGNGDADVLIGEVEFAGIPGEVVLRNAVATRSGGVWAPLQRFNGVDGPVGGGRVDADVAAGAGGDALFAEALGLRSNLPMTYSARMRTTGAATYGAASTLHSGAFGEVRAAPLRAGRFLVLIRSGSGLRSRAGSPATGFGDALVFSGTDGAALLGLAGATSGRAAALWATTGGNVNASIYDDSAGPGDAVAPVLSRLTVQPRRFKAHRRSRIRFRLSERARVRIRVDRLRPGFRRGDRCVVRRPRSGRLRRCTRFKPVGAFTVTRPAGRTAVRLRRFVRHHHLGPARYRVTAIPRDAAGNRGKAKRARFRILSRG